jgi:hypothetical protein
VKNFVTFPVNLQGGLDKGGYGSFQDSSVFRRGHDESRLGSPLLDPIGPPEAIQPTESGIPLSARIPPQVRIKRRSVEETVSMNTV